MTINNKSKYVMVLDIVGLDISHLSSGLVPTLSEIANGGEYGYLKPSFPSVTSTVQASVLSGKHPNQHGIISNGLYDKENYKVSFWEQSSNLVQTDRIWDILKKKNSSITTSIIFYQNTMYANSDYVITPKPIHLEDGSMDMWCYSKPPGYYESVTKTINEFDLFSYWGPFASFKSTEWISKCVEHTIENYKPNLLFAYFPQLDYSSQKFGKNSIQVKEDLKKIDQVVATIIKKVKDLGIYDKTEFIIFSEYGFNDVNAGIPINRILKQKDLLATRTIKNKEYIDYEYSKAFAVVDHQVANIYLQNTNDKNLLTSILQDVDGVDKIYDEKDKQLLKVDHPRTGDLVITSKKDKWFSYYWWIDDDKAPTFTKTVDIHRKPGYDPLDLFIDPNTKSISLNTSLIKGSHGRPYDLETGEGFSTFIFSKKKGLDKDHKYFGNNILDCTDLFKKICNNFL